MLGVFKPLNVEHDYTLDEVEGHIPEGLVGTLYRNGAGRWESGGSPVGHLFDGDGMVSMFIIEGGRIRYRNRYVRTEHFRPPEDKSGLPARTLGALRPGGTRANAFRPAANPANTPFSAHPKFDPRTGDMFNFGLDLVPHPRIRCYRVDASGRLHKLATADLPSPAFNHDFALTNTDLVFVIDPLFANLRKVPSALVGRTPFDQVIRYRRERGTTGRSHQWRNTIRRR